MYLKINQKINLKSLIEELINVGYYRESDAFDSGSFSQKGDAILIWPVNYPFKIRIDLFGDIIEKIVSVGDLKKQKELSS